MRVTFDDQIFSHQARGGISNYFVNLAVRFSKDADLGVELSGFPIYTKNAHLKEAGMGSSLPLARLNKAPILRFSNRAVSKFRKLKRIPSPEIVHHTYYFGTPWRSHPESRHIVTVHDMIPEMFPEYFPSGNPHARKEEHIFSADAIACVSETTKSDLMALYPDLNVPVVVTPLGVSEEFHPSFETQGDHANYFLFVGPRGNYKNFDLLLEAFALIFKSTTASLLLVGGGSIQPSEASRFSELGLENRILHATPKNSELVEMYQKAICLIYPSKYEGFGLPPLEAMASGCPVLLSETPALREVAGNAGEYFPASDPESLAAKMIEMSTNAEFRRDSRERGLERASLFSWSQTASKTRDCYLESLKS